MYRWMTESIAKEIAWKSESKQCCCIMGTCCNQKCMRHLKRKLKIAHKRMEQRKYRPSTEWQRSISTHLGLQSSKKERMLVGFHFQWKLFGMVNTELRYILCPLSAFNRFFFSFTTITKSCACNSSQEPILFYHTNFKFYLPPIGTLTYSIGSISSEWVYVYCVRASKDVRPSRIFIAG